MTEWISIEQGPPTDDYWFGLVRTSQGDIDLVEWWGGEIEDASGDVRDRGWYACDSTGGYLSGGAEFVEDVTHYARVAPPHIPPVDKVMKA